MAKDENKAAGLGLEQPGKSIETMQAELAALELRVSELTAQNSALAEAQGSGQGIFERALGPSTRNKQLWKFRVSCNDSKIQPREVKAVDESEAIRQYVLIASGNPNSPLDTVKYVFKAECLEAKKRIQNAIDKHDAWRRERGYGDAPKQMLTPNNAAAL
jgi:hypothetical protein